VLNFVHKLINNKDKLPDIFPSYFIQNRYIHYYETRMKCDLPLTNMQSTVGKNSITSIKGCNLWNKLPDQLKAIISNKAFAVRLKQYDLRSI